MENLKVEDLEKNRESMAEIAVDSTKIAINQRIKYLESSVSDVIPGMETVWANLLFDNIMDTRYTYLMGITVSCLKSLKNNADIASTYQMLPISLMPQKKEIINLLVNFSARGDELKAYANLKEEEEIKAREDAIKRNANIIEFKRK